MEATEVGSEPGSDDLLTLPSIRPPLPNWGEIVVRFQAKQIASAVPDSMSVNPLFARRAEDLSVPRFVLPSESMLPETAYQIVHDEAMLDGNARLNLATFVTTWMEPTAAKLYSDSVRQEHDRQGRVPADRGDRGPVLAHARRPVARARSGRTRSARSTIGSSEACMLGGLALKRRWQQARRNDGKPADQPNLVMSSAVQVVWEKFANYWEVEPRYVPITDDHPTLDGYQLDKYVDENTIGVVAILGQTYTGVYEPVQAIAAALDDLQARDRSGHPDPRRRSLGRLRGAIPCAGPDWDFQLPRVHSISTSGHKYGLVYPGIGWVVWRTADMLPEDLIFQVSYLGGEMPTLALNFSRPGAQVLLQYYNFLRLGFEGYRRVQQASQDVALHLSHSIADMGPFELMSDGSDLPVFAWRLGPNCNGMWDSARSEQPVARARLAGAGLPATRQPERHHRSAHRGAKRGVHGSRRLPVGQYPHGRRLPREPVEPDAARGTRQRLLSPLIRLWLARTPPLATRRLVELCVQGQR